MGPTAALTAGAATGSGEAAQVPITLAEASPRSPGTPVPSENDLMGSDNDLMGSDSEPEDFSLNEFLAEADRDNAKRRQEAVSVPETVEAASEAEEDDGDEDDGEPLNKDFLQYMDENLSMPAQDVIEALTSIASESCANPLPIVHAVCVRVVTTQGHAQLAAWYLMDSICRRVMEPFVEHFSELLPRMMQEYMPLGGPDTPRYLKLLKVWIKRGQFPSHTPLIHELWVKATSPSANAAVNAEPNPLR